ncbi:filamentous hemagglutinin N-terminal domain-containing protein [Phenylobacterium sp.]|uniref:two-partner secretion domain-containing protein n=1 Tax=Phenylobacterium sp. TaxID=1871053 RepID=UPI00301E1240
MSRTRAAATASRLVLALALGTIASVAAPARVGAQTVITPDVGNAFALGTTVSGAGGIVTIDGGTRAGANLFHSFSRFDVGVGVTARWTAADPGGVANVVNRVTGGQFSRIDGTLDSMALPNAAFWFINPAGMVFGPTAVVNVPSAAHFSTASHLGFADGGRFTVAAPDGSVLSVAPPESFGFVGGEQVIVLDGVGQGFAPDTAVLSFTASDIGVFDANLAARGLDLTAVGDVVLEVDVAFPLSLSARGAVEILDSKVVARADTAPGADLRITGGSVRLSGSSVTSDAVGSAPGSDISIAALRLGLGGGSVVGSSTQQDGRGGDVRIVAGEVDIDGGGLFAVSGAGGAGGDIMVTASIVSLRNAPAVSANALGSGDGGTITIEADVFEADGGVLVATTSGSGSGGDIRVTAARQDWIDGVAASTATGGGRPGDVVLIGERISLSGGAYGSSPGAASNSGSLVIEASQGFEGIQTFLTVSGEDVGGAGVIAIRSPEIFFEGSAIESNALGDGAAGVVIIDGRSVLLSDTRVTAEARGGAGAQPGAIQIRGADALRLRGGFVNSIAYSAADGGTVLIEGGDVFLDDTIVQSDTFGDGDAGSIFVRADNELLVRNGQVSSDSNFNGAAGGVTLEGRSLTIDTSAKVSSDTFAFGQGGTVTLRGGQILLADGAQVTSRATGGTGNAGAVLIEADTLALEEAFVSSDALSLGDAGAVVVRVNRLTLSAIFENSTYISSDTLSLGNAGGVAIDAKSISLSGPVFISSNALGSGDAGVVAIRTDSLSLGPGTFIASDTQGPGAAGDVTIQAGTLELKGEPGFLTYISSDSLGAGDAGAVTIQAGTLRMSGEAFISSDAYVSGAAGDVTVAADSVKLDSVASIRSGAFSFGPAGNVRVTAGEIALDTEASITSDAFEGSTGDAGLVEIAAKNVTVRGDARISTSSRGEGDAGGVRLVSETVLLEDGGLISSAADIGATGASGVLEIVADTVTLRDGGAISTISLNPNPAGLIDIRTGTLRVDGVDSVISSENLSGDTTLGLSGPGGDAGTIRIRAENLTVSNGGRISTNAAGGAAGDIEIAIPRPGILLLEGARAPGIIQTSSGSATGGRITISDPLAIISNGGSILALGELRGANVTIQSRYFVNSSDRVNTVAVDGDFRLETGLYDISSGVVSRDLSVLDASRVLRGQCPAARSTGAVSQLITRPVGPYVREVAPEGLRAPDARTPDAGAPAVRAPAPGACP